MAENITQNPYETPTETYTKANHCPKCGDHMEDGELHSNSAIKWYGTTLSKMKKFITGGETIAKTKSGLGCKYPAFYCKKCKLFIIQ